MGKVYDNEWFIKRAKELHGETYDYSKVVFAKTRGYVNIICRTHGVFKQRASSHLEGVGCKKCASENQTNKYNIKKTKLFEEWESNRGCYYGLIYKATDLLNNKIYIGQTTLSLRDRVNRHFKHARNGSSFNFSCVIRSYDLKDVFVWEIIDLCKSKDELNEKEVYWISKLDSMNPEIGYNKYRGGSFSNNNNIWNNLSEERKNRIRDRMREASTGVNNPFYGRSHTEETRRILSERKKGRVMPEDVKRKISIANKGKNRKTMGEL